MANIIAYMRKEVEKGNTLMDKKGNFINPEKLENTMRKSYVAGLKDGSISFEKPFAEYLQEQIEETCIPVSSLEEEMAHFICYTSSDLGIPEPTETIAQ